MRVLYIHGLESGPGGRKVHNLRAAGFDVVARAMPCGRRALTRDPTAWPLLALAWAGRPRRVTRRIVERSLEVQRPALAGVDVVVGSSFGGAIATRLLLEGSWTGPTVLLCPAGGLVAERLREPFPRLHHLAESVRERILVVHGRQDEVVPYTHSERLVSAAVRLQPVDDDHRLQRTSSPQGLAGWVRTVASDDGGS